MTAASPALPLPRPAARRPALGRSIATLASRRLALTAHTPRELFVPLVTPVLFALVIAPALKTALHTSGAYESYVAIGTVGLLVPLNAMFLGIGSIVDRISGAQRELLAAPIPRGVPVLGNVPVALLTTLLQVGTLIGMASARRIHFHPHGAGVLWFVAAVLFLTVGFTGIAETLASRVPRQEEYIARLPAVAIAPWFLAGSLFPISAMPIGLTWIARFLPLTHALALMRYGLLSDSTGLHAIWHMQSTTGSALLSLAVLVLFAALLLRVAMRVFTRAATA
jgi:ABC-type polysaccharide/polyol phosphate export permease